MIDENDPEQIKLYVLGTGAFGVIATGITFFFPFSYKKKTAEDEKLIIKNTDSVVQGLNKTDSSFVNTMDMRQSNEMRNSNEITPEKLNEEIKNIDPGFRNTTTD